jgi:hypothetical protein
MKATSKKLVLGCFVKGIWENPSRNGEDGATEEITTNLVNIQCMNYPFINFIYHDHKIKHKLFIK